MLFVRDGLLFKCKPYHQLILAFIFMQGCFRNSMKMKKLHAVNTLFGSIDLITFDTKNKNLHFTTAMQNSHNECKARNKI